MAKSRSIGGIYAELSLRDKNFASGLKKAKKEASLFQKMTSSAGAGIAAVGIAAPFAAAGVAMKQAIDAGGELNDMMTSTGAKGGGLLVMQKAFENVGLSASDVPGALFKMQKALGGVNEDGDATSNAFAKIGLSIDELKSLDPVTAFQKTSAAIAGIADPASRTAAAMEIFGKSGGKLIAVMADGEAFSQARQQLGSLTETLPKMAAEFDMVGDAMGQWDTLIKQIGVSLATRLMPVLQSYAALMNSMDFGDFSVMGMFSSRLTNGDSQRAKAMAGDWADADPLHGKSINDVNSQKLAAANADFWNGKAQERNNWVEKNALDEERTAKAKAKTMAAAMASYNEESAMVSAQLSGNEKLVASLEREQAIREKIAELTKSGFSAKDAAGPAAAMVDAQIKLANRTEYVAAVAPVLDVNDYQKRGLSLGGTIADPTTNKQLNLLGSIEKILNKIEKNGGTW